MAGCALVDFLLPGLNGLELQSKLAEAPYKRPIVFLSGSSDIPTSVQAMKAGAIDFLVKPISADRLFLAIQLAINRDIEHRRIQAANERMETLSPREREVLGHVIAGRQNKQIAADIGTGEKTVKVHRAHVMEKLQVRTVADLVRFVLRWKKFAPDLLKAAKA